MRLTIKLMTLLGLMGYCVAGHCGEWRLKATPRLEANDWFLDFEITSLKSTSTSVFTSNLPWGIRHSLDLVAIPIREGAKALSGPLYFDDPGPGKIDILPGQTLRGSVSLSYRFQTLRDQEKTTAMAVCYRYRFNLLEKNLKEDATECVLLNAPSK